MSRSKNSLARWWGFALVVAVLAALPSREVPAAILFALSGLGLVWALFFAPVWCGAVIAGFTAPGEFFDLGASAAVLVADHSAVLGLPLASAAVGSRGVTPDDRLGK